MTPIAIVGMGMTPDDLPPALRARIDAAEVLVGGKRHLDCFPDHRGQRLEISGSLVNLARSIKEQMAARTVVVLASGDPLFFGIGGYLTRVLGPENVTIHPNISAVSAAFARLKLPWHDAHVVSLHGREDTAPLQNALDCRDKIVVFTDPSRHPGWLARTLLKHRVEHFSMWVLEQMGSSAERVAQYDLETAAATDFADPNLVVLLRRSEPAGPPDGAIGIGMADDRFEHERGLITKAEVRAVTLSRLRLQSGQTFWDLGAGSGAVSVEASLLLRGGQIVAVEKNRDRIRLIESNRRRFKVDNMRIVHTVLPGGLPGLPDPDRVFIGGGGRDLPAIITAAADRLNPGGIIVANTVILASATAALETMKGLGFDTDIVQIQISRGRPMPWGERLQAENPVFIISGAKKSEE